MLNLEGILFGEIGLKIKLLLETTVFGHSFAMLLSKGNFQFILTGLMCGTIFPKQDI